MNGKYLKDMAARQEQLKPSDFIGAHRLHDGGAVVNEEGTHPLLGRVITISRYNPLRPPHSPRALDVQSVFPHLANAPLKGW
jgi:hypothetical protein